MWVFTIYCVGFLHCMDPSPPYKYNSASSFHTKESCLHVAKGMAEQYGRDPRKWAIRCDYLGTDYKTN